MELGFFKKYAVILGRNLKAGLGLPILLAAALLCAVPVIFGIQALDRTASAVPLEMAAALTGILLFTPLFAPEAEEGIRDTVEAKYTPYNAVIAARVTGMALFELLSLAVFVLIMDANGCDAGLSMALGTFAQALFLGGLGFLGSSVTKNTAIGYMLPVMYYILNCVGGKTMFGPFYLFSMQTGSFIEKWFLAGAALLLFPAGFLFRRKNAGAGD